MANPLAAGFGVPTGGAELLSLVFSIVSLALLVDAFNKAEKVVKGAVLGEIPAIRDLANLVATLAVVAALTAAGKGPDLVMNTAAAFYQALNQRTAVGGTGHGAPDVVITVFMFGYLVYLAALAVGQFLELASEAGTVGEQLARSGESEAAAKRLGELIDRAAVFLIVLALLRWVGFSPYPLW